MTRDEDYRWELARQDAWLRELLTTSRGECSGQEKLILEVVLVRRLVTWVLGIWSGKGMGKG